MKLFLSLFISLALAVAITIGLWFAPVMPLLPADTFGKSPVVTLYQHELTPAPGEAQCMAISEQVKGWPIVYGLEEGGCVRSSARVVLVPFIVDVMILFAAILLVKSLFGFVIMANRLKRTAKS